MSLLADFTFLAWLCRRISRTTINTYENEAKYRESLNTCSYFYSHFPPRFLPGGHYNRFIVWLEKRIEDCEDLEERVGLKSLLDIIKQVYGVQLKLIEVQEEARSDFYG